MTLTQFIEAMQISQYDESVGETEAWNIDDLEGLYSAFSNGSDGKKGPVIVTIFGPEGGHALLAYDVKTTDKNTKHLYVYDCNYPNKERYITLKTDSNGKIKSWYYYLNDCYHWGSEYDGCYISYLEYQDYYNVWANRGKEKLSKLNVVSSKSKNLAIYDKNNKDIARLEEGNLITDRMDVFPMRKMEIGENSDRRECIFLPTGTYTIVNEDETQKEFEVAMLDNNLAAEVSTSGTAVTLQVDDSSNINQVDLDLQEGDTYNISLKSAYSYDHNKVQIQGNATGGVVSASQKKGDISLSNCAGAEISIDGQQVKTNTISASAGRGGRIEPAGTVKVPEGGNQTYTITPERNYRIDDVTVDGISVGAVTTYTFKSVDADHVIAASFKPMDGSSGTQKITGASAITKLYGDKPFSLKAQAKGKLRYKSSNTKVAVVSPSGKVTIKAPGKVIITITAAAAQEYKTAVKKVTITVKPKKTAVAKLTSSKKGTLTAVWKRDTKASGYQVLIAQNSKFTKGKKAATVKSNKTTKATFKKLKSKKTYYVKVRAYKKSGKATIYGPYSKTKMVRIK